MARADWTAHTGSVTLDGTHVRSGSSAALVPASNEYTTVATWDQSASDSPAYGKFRSYFYFTNTGYFEFFFRRQDTDNMYAVTVRTNYGNDVELSKYVGGTRTEGIDLVAPDADPGEGAWVGVGAYWWDVQGTLNVGVEIDANGDGTWSDNLARPLKDPNPDLPGGGGVGFGQDGSLAGDNDYDFWVDDSEVFY